MEPLRVASAFPDPPFDQSSDPPHVAPRRQYVIALSGHLEFTTRNGDRFELHPGDVLLAEDTTGGGHRWRILGADPWRRAYVSLEDAP